MATLRAGAGRSEYLCLLKCSFDSYTSIRCSNVRVCC